MQFVINIPKCKNVNLQNALKALKKEGDKFPIELPTGTKVEYIRGANFEGHTFGNKFSLYKKITKPDGTVFVSNRNVIGDNIYLNEIFRIKNGEKDVYTMTTSNAQGYEIRPFNPFRNYPKELKKALENNTSLEATRYSCLSDYLSKSSQASKPHVQKKPLKPEQAKPIFIDDYKNLEITTTKSLPNCSPENAKEIEEFFELSNKIVLDDYELARLRELSKKWASPNYNKKLSIPQDNHRTKPLKANDGWEVVID